MDDLRKKKCIQDYMQQLAINYFSLAMNAVLDMQIFITKTLPFQIFQKDFLIA
jgi:hypothetical protein